MMNVLLLQLDGKLPNIAIMRLAAHHRDQGDSVTLQQARTVASVQRCPWDSWDRVYASTIFQKTRPVAEALLRAFPDAVVGGTGWSLTKTLESVGVTTRYQDYSLYPSFRQSMGFTQRGCRLDCPFCVVPKLEGKVRQEQTIAGIWRGEPWPRELLLLDNDFFGQPAWRERISEIKAGRFKVSFNQGINARMLNDETAAAIASVDYRDDGMKVKRIYSAWDNLSDEGPLFRGLRCLTRAGVKPDAIMVYCLCGYGETLEERLYRNAKLREFGARPYPMPYSRTPELIGFQRWVIGAYDKRVSWERWVAAGYEPRRLGKIADEPLFVGV
jgi:hypothetical protein